MSTPTDASGQEQPSPKILLAGLPDSGHELLFDLFRQMLEKVKNPSTQSPPTSFEPYTLDGEPNLEQLQATGATHVIIVMRNCVTESDRLYPSRILGEALNAPPAFEPSPDDAFEQWQTYSENWAKLANLSQSETASDSERNFFLIPIRFEDILFSRDAFLALVRSLAPSANDEGILNWGFRQLVFSAEAVNRKNPEVIWRNWSLARRERFVELCGEAMRACGYELPCHPHQPPDYANASVSSPVRWHIVSPVEPSGITWLLNCFLWLGIKTYRDIGIPMWIRQEDHHRLDSRHTELCAALPILSSKGEFKFRHDIEVEWSHDWPRLKKYQDARVILFTRDPRDSLYSSYRRLSGNKSYPSFLESLDSRTLLSRVHSWRFYHLLWLAFPGIQVYRFEDYKADATALLTQILNQMGLEYSATDIESAVENSTQEKAKAAETLFRQTTNDTGAQVNRSGHHGEWKQTTDDRLLAKIETVAGDVMNSLGYSLSQEYQAPEKSTQNYWPHLGLLPNFRNGMHLQANVGESTTQSALHNPHIRNVLQFIESVNLKEIYCAREPDFVVRQQFENLGKYLQWLLVELNMHDPEEVMAILNQDYSGAST